MDYPVDEVLGSSVYDELRAEQIKRQQIPYVKSGTPMFTKKMLNQTMNQEGSIVQLPSMRFGSGGSTTIPTFYTNTAIYLIDRHAVIDVEYTSYRHVHPMELTDERLSCKMEDIVRLYDYYDRTGIEPPTIDWDGKAVEYNLLEEEQISRVSTWPSQTT